MPKITVDTSSLLRSYALLKGVPLATVVRNASRDFARGAYEATPLASISRSEYYVVKDKAGKAVRRKDGSKIYLHQSQVKVRLAGAKRRRRKTEDSRYFSKVRIQKGWSKSTWVGVFRALGIPRNTVKGVPQEAASRSGVSVSTTPDSVTATITDLIRFDAFGRTMDVRTQEIADAGFARAASKISADLKKILQQRWEGR